MDFVEERSVSRFLAQPTEDKAEFVFLDPKINEAKLDTMYEQIAGCILELSHPDFPRIGSISKDMWCPANRLLLDDP